MSPSKAYVDPMHSDESIEQCLRNVVRNCLEEGVEITVNKARSEVEHEVGLPAGFLKTGEWKSRSKEIISAAVEEVPSPERLKKGPSADSKAADQPNLPKKRKAKDSAPKLKRRKTVESEDDETVALTQDSLEDETTAQPKDVTESDASLDKTVVQDIAEGNAEDDGNDHSPVGRSTQSGVQDGNGDNARDESDEFSDVIDEPLPKKKKQQRPKKSSSPKAKAKKAGTASKPKAAGKDLSPDEETIKDLQSWLVKCGIRKVWGKELKKFDTNKDKIQHLRAMLQDAGMTGRFSAEKARQIKARRELAAELEDTQAFNELFGDGRDAASDDASDGEKKTRRRSKLKSKVDFDSDENDAGIDGASDGEQKPKRRQKARGVVGSDSDEDD